MPYSFCIFVPSAQYISLVYLCPAISRKYLMCYLGFFGRTCFSHSSLFRLLAIIHPIAQSKNVGVIPVSFLSLSLPSSSMINSCWFHFQYKSCTITSHHLAITTHPRLQEQFPSWYPCTLFCPWQFILYKSAKGILQTLITSHHSPD